MQPKIYKGRSEFVQDLKHAFLNAKFNISPSLQKAIENSLSERDETAKSILDKDGNMIPDIELCDYENVPLKENIYKFFEREVKPYVPDTWINDSITEKIGYEIGRIILLFKFRAVWMIYLR
jgi:type I restriction enzyme M protein